MTMNSGYDDTHKLGILDNNNPIKEEEEQTQRKMKKEQKRKSYLSHMKN